MAWETPDDFVTGQLVTQANMQQISDNLEALKAPPADQAILDDVANYTKSGTAWADIDASFNVQVVTTGGAVLVCLFTTVSLNTAAQNVYLDLELETNGTVIGRLGTDDGLQAVTSTVSGYLLPMMIQWRSSGLAAGTHVFSPQWKVSGGTATMYAGNGVNTSVHGQLWAAEIS